MKNRTPFLFLFLFIAAPAYTETNDCPMHAEHSKKHHNDHHAEVDRMGDQVMGFEHSKSKHHFILKEDGGMIEARTLDAQDTETLKQIQSHMREISQLFAEGDFSKPEAIHGIIPPGVETMQKLKDRIEFKYEALEDGARVNLITSDHEALEAIHDFLRFQIRDHGTGDPMEVE